MVIFIPTEKSLWPHSRHVDKWLSGVTGSSEENGGP